DGSMIRERISNGFTIEEVKCVIKDFLRYYYDIELEIPVEFSSELKRKWGMFTYKQYKKDLNVNGVRYKKGDIVKGSMKILINEKLVESDNMELVDKIIKHEALHYALYKKGLPFKDGDPYFERELERLGLVKSKISRYELGIKNSKEKEKNRARGKTVIKYRNKKR